MSLIKQYEEQEKERQADAKQSDKHYLSVNLPGDRDFEINTTGVRQRIAEMKKERDKPNYDKKG